MSNTIAESEGHVAFWTGLTLHSMPDTAGSHWGDSESEWGKVWCLLLWLLLLLTWTLCQLLYCSLSLHELRSQLLCQLLHASWGLFCCWCTPFRGCGHWFQQGWGCYRTRPLAIYAYCLSQSMLWLSDLGHPHHIWCICSMSPTPALPSAHQWCPRLCARSSECTYSCVTGHRCITGL